MSLTRRSGGGSSGISIGDPIAGSEPNLILYVDPSGNLGQLGALQYSGSMLNLFDSSFSISSPAGQILSCDETSLTVSTAKNVLDDGNGNMDAQGGFALGSQYFNPVNMGEILSGGTSNVRGLIFDWNPSFDNGDFTNIGYPNIGNLNLVGDSSQGSANGNLLLISMNDINPSSTGVFFQANIFDGSLSGSLLAYGLFGVRANGYALCSATNGLRVEVSGGGLGGLITSGFSDTILIDGIVYVGDYQHVNDGTYLAIDSIANAFTFENDASVEITGGLLVDMATVLDNGAIFTDGSGHLSITTVNASSPAIYDASKILSSGSYSGNTTKMATVSGSITTGDFLTWDSSGNVIDGGGKIYAPTTADLTAQSAAVSSVLAATAPNDGAKHQYSIGGYLAITAISAGTVTFQINYTDETGTVRTANLFPMGLTSASLTATGAFQFPNTLIRVSPNTVLKLVTTFVGVSVAYDVGGFLQRIN